MKVEILQGTVRHNDKVFVVGQVVNLPDAGAKALIREGVVKDYLADDESKTKPVEKPEDDSLPISEQLANNTTLKISDAMAISESLATVVEVEEEEKVEEEESEVEEAPEPSMDWTKPELIEAAGLDANTQMNKAEILEVIQKGGDKG